ncbi:MAG: OmpH family outer membrane protein [Bdellovibrionales bacterium]|jgi:outer membrane protein|nr:OmpH family outer membrane protein [Bdellovibrionales bacterium]
MKKIILFVLAVTLTASAWSSVLIGKVDIQKVLVTVKEGQKVRDKLKKSFESKQSILKKEEEGIKSLQETYKKQSLVMNDQAKTKKEREIQGKIMALQQKSMGFQKEIQQMEEKLKKPILEKVRVIIEEVSKSTGVEMTFEASTAPIVYAKSEKDLTDNVIELYNKRHK